MYDEKEVNEQLAALADHLFERRTAILENWRHAVDDDPALPTASTLARREFYDHIPAALNAFAQNLRARYLAQKSEAAEEQKALAAIVKRLCELLDATLELKTGLSQGSIFRVILPRSYEDD